MGEEGLFLQHGVFPAEGRFQPANVPRPVRVFQALILINQQLAGQGLQDPDDPVKDFIGTSGEACLMPQQGIVIEVMPFVCPEPYRTDSPEPAATARIPRASSAQEAGISQNWQERDPRKLSRKLSL